MSAETAPNAFLTLAIGVTASMVGVGRRVHGESAAILRAVVLAADGSDSQRAGTDRSSRSVKLVDKEIALA